MISNSVVGQPLMFWLIGAMFAAPMAYLVPVWLQLPERRAQAEIEALQARVRSWWMLAGTVLVAAFLSTNLVIVLCGLLCYAALKEYVSMIPLRMAYRPTVLLAFLAIPIQLSLATYARLPLFATFYPDRHVWHTLSVDGLLATQTQRTRRCGNLTLGIADHSIQHQPRSAFTCATSPCGHTGGRRRVDPLSLDDDVGKRWFSPFLLPLQSPLRRPSGPAYPG